MGEVPILTLTAQVFKIDPESKKKWLPLSEQPVDVSYYHDKSKKTFRIISINKNEVLINSSVLPNIKLTEISPKFCQWFDSYSATVFGLGFSNEVDMKKFSDKFEEVKSCLITEMTALKNPTDFAVVDPIASKLQSKPKWNATENISSVNNNNINNINNNINNNNTVSNNTSMNKVNNFFGQREEVSSVIKKESNNISKNSNNDILNSIDENSTIVNSQKRDVNRNNININSRDGMNNFNNQFRDMNVLKIQNRDGYISMNTQSKDANLMNALNKEINTALSERELFTKKIGASNVTGRQPIVSSSKSDAEETICTSGKCQSIIQNLRLENDKFKLQIIQSSSSNKELETRCDDLKSNIDTLNSNIPESKKQAEEFKKLLNNSQEEISYLKTKLSEFEANQIQLLEVREKLKDSERSAITMKEELMKSKRGFQDKQDIQLQNQKLNSKIQLLEEDNLRLNRHVTDLKIELDVASKNKPVNRIQLQKLQEQISTKINELYEMNDRLADQLETIF